MSASQVDAVSGLSSSPGLQQQECRERGGDAGAL